MKSSYSAVGADVLLVQDIVPIVYCLNTWKINENSLIYLVSFVHILLVACAESCYLMSVDKWHAHMSLTEEHWLDASLRKVSHTCYKVVKFWVIIVRERNITTLQRYNVIKIVASISWENSVRPWLRSKVVSHSPNWLMPQFLWSLEEIALILNVLHRL